jgi:hypothetical protein
MMMMMSDGRRVCVCVNQRERGDPSMQKGRRRRRNTTALAAAHLRSPELDEKLDPPVVDAW